MKWGYIVSLFTHFYGMTLDEIRALTVPQYEDRMQDVAAITKALQGEGRGRLQTKPSRLKALASRAGVRLPSKLGDT